MARLARIVAVNVPHHITQRGNAKQFVLSNDPERLAYLDLLEQYLKLYRLSLLGYCLMSNHVHLVLIPPDRDSLAAALKQTHGRYASYWNAAHKSSGHVWQGRFYSCALDDAHLWIALRYAELNPVRAKLASKPWAWTWSSAKAHCGQGDAPPWLDMDLWSRRWSAESWRAYLSCAESEENLAAIRQCTHTGRPLGTAEFLQSLEQSTLRNLTPQKGGRPRNATPPSTQKVLAF